MAEEEERDDSRVFPGKSGPAASFHSAKRDTPSAYQSGFSPNDLPTRGERVASGGDEPAKRGDMPSAYSSEFSLHESPTRGEIEAPGGDEQEDVAQGNMAAGPDANGAQPAVEQSSSAAASSVPTRLSRDKPTLDDTLGFRVYAKAIARFLTDKESKPPLTISIQAPWGGGKTSLMLMIEEELDPKGERPGRGDNSKPADKLTVADLEEEVAAKMVGEAQSALPKIDARRVEGSRRTTVWFNAWKYENTSQVWAGLVDAILQQVPMRLRRKERELFWFRLNLSRVNGAQIRQSLHSYFFDVFARSSAGLALAILAAVATAILSGLGLHRLANLPVQSASGYSAIFGLVCGVFAKWVFARLKFRQEAASQLFKNLIQAPAYDKELGFVHQAESDLRRVFASLPVSEGLVIFIDDLDRCSPTKVAAVLEAVNLIIAGDFPDCCFVLGMDAEMVAAALQAAHKDLTIGTSDSRIPVGWRFMDKFVQLPFVMPPLESGPRDRFIQHLFGEAGGNVPEGAPPPEPDTHQQPLKDLPEFVKLTQKMSPLFGGNPRELKRFTNLLRFHWFLWAARHDQKSDVPSAEALAVWTAMSVKWPEHVRWLRRIEHRVPAEATLKAVLGLSHDSHGETLSQYSMGACRLYGSEAVNHLAILEAISQEVVNASFASWRDGLKKLYEMGETPAPWVADESLFVFYQRMPDILGTNGTLSSHVGKGFW